MAVDPKLRDVLDTLSDAPAKARPKEEREYLMSVLRRLNIRDVAVPEEPPAAPAGPSDAYAREEELRRLREQQEEDEGALRMVQAERDQLRDRQAELEERLARLEAGGRSGLTFVDEGPVEAPEPVVEFTRVDFPAGGDEDLMEFEALGTEPGSAFASPDTGAWESEEPQWEEGAAWGEETAWDERPATGVEWDTDESPATTARPPAPEPLERQAPAANDTAWSQPEPPEGAHTWEEVEPQPAAQGARADTGFEDLDERTKSDLAELEAQLAELERELAKRDDKTRRRDA